MKTMILSAIALVTMGIASLAHADTQYPTLKLDGSGNAYAVWLNSVESDGNYVVQTSNASAIQITSESAWSSNLTTHTGILGTNTAPALGVDTGGDAVLIWVDVNSDTGLNALYAKLRPATSGTWSSSPAVINFTGSVSGIVQAEINSSGQITAIVSAYVDSEMSNIAEYVVAATISGGNVWSGPVQISP